MKEVVNNSRRQADKAIEVVQKCSKRSKDSHNVQKSRAMFKNIGDGRKYRKGVGDIGKSQKRVFPLHHPPSKAWRPDVPRKE